MDTKTGIISTEIQDFEILRSKGLFYVDKTKFIRDWWDEKDPVTLITRPQRFGKTLNLSMMECFFSEKYAGHSDLFEGLEIWQDEMMRKEQGKWPVLFLSFADAGQDTWSRTKRRINGILADACRSYEWMIRDAIFTDEDRDLFSEIAEDMDDVTASLSLSFSVSGSNGILGKGF